MNHLITAKEVRLISFDGKQLGIVNIHDALSKAEELKLDLVEIASQVNPPVCKIMDFGKYIFEQRKRLKKKSKRIQIKELKMRPGTDVGDYLVKIKQAIGFLQDGNKVKFMVKFRGRELAYQQHGKEILTRAINDLIEYGTVEQSPKMEGKQMVMLMIPGKHKN